MRKAIQREVLSGAVLVVLGVAGVVGCAPGTQIPAGISRSSTAAGSAEAAIGALPTPPGFDPAKARLSLAQIPDDPPAPARGPTSAPSVPDSVRRTLDEAQRLFAEQHYTEAILEAEKALRTEPASAEGQRLMALACLLSGNQARARLAAQRAIELHPDDLAAHYVLGRCGDKAGKPDEAARAYRLALKCTPDAPDAPYLALTRYWLGVLLYDTGYYAAAAQQLEGFESDVAGLGARVAEAPELAMVARVQRGAAAIRAARAHAWLGQYGPAADVLKTAAERTPTDFELRGEYIRMLIRAGRTPRAIEEAARLVADAKGQRESVELLLAVHRVTGHPERAVDSIREIVQGQPDNTELWGVYAEALRAAGRTKEAAGSLRDVLARHPEAGELRWKLSELYRSSEDWPNWFGVLAEQLAGQPADYVRVSAALQQLPPEVARRLLDRPAVTQPAAPPASQPSGARIAAGEYLRALLADRVDRLDQARADFMAALRRSPEFFPAAVSMGDMYLRRCRWADAITAAESAYAAGAEPNHQIERLLAQAYDSLDDLDNAVAHYQKAAQLNRADARSMLLLGELYERTDALPMAEKQYQAAVAVDAGNMLAREHLLHLLLSRVTPLSPVQQQHRLVASVLSELSAMQRAAPLHPAAIRCASMVQFLSSRDRQAYLNALRKLTDEHPDDLKTREDLAKTLFQFRDYRTARTQAEEMLARDPSSPVAGELLASSLIKLLAYDEAGEQLQRMLAVYPNREAWLRQWVELSLVQQKYDQAIEVCERLLAMKGAKGSPERTLAYRLKEQQCYRAAGRLGEARRLAEQWMTEPAKDERLRERYRTLLLSTDAEAEDYAKWIERCQAWLKAEPAKVEVQQWLLSGLIKAGRADEALATGMNWLAQSPLDDVRLAWVVDALEASRRFDSAVEVVRGRLAAAVKPEDRRAALANVASTCLRARRYDETIAALKELLAGIQSQEQAVQGDELQRMLARVLAQAGRADEAISYLNHLLAAAQSDDRRAELLRNLSFAYQKLGRHDLAEQRLREAHALAPTDPGVNNDLGYTLADAGRNLEEAGRMLRLAVGEEPLQAAYMDSLGWLFYKSGQPDEARVWLQRATAMEGGRDAVIFDHLGDVQWRLGQRDQALLAWKRALHIYDEQVEAGEENAEPQTIERIRQKLQAAGRGSEPPVATAPASRPAREAASGRR